MDRMVPESFRILAVDDQRGVLRSYKKTLNGNGNRHAEQAFGNGCDFSVTLCRRGDKALELADEALRNQEPFHAVFLDADMKRGPDGLWMGEQIRQIDPDASIVVVTGRNQRNPETLAEKIPPADKLLFLRKPFYKHEVRQVARTLRARWHAENQVRQGASEVRKTVLSAIKAIALTVETRDPYTAGHQQRVANLARAIAEEMGLPQEQTEGLYMAGIIHDLGKLSIPTDILSKPTRLSELEFALIKTHPQAGYDIVKDIEFPWPVAKIVLQHHEKLDGSGYPFGLRKDEILLESRILTIADVVEAIASDRPYRPAIGMEAALEEISSHRGRMYDPDAVDACLKIIKEDGYRLK